jgi:hypothetical protein
MRQWMRRNAARFTFRQSATPIAVVTRSSLQFGAVNEMNPTENERGLEYAIIRMALSAQEVELSPDDLATMRRLTKTVQRYLRVSDIALGKRNGAADQKPRASVRPRLPEGG